jgi:hypothetical protein
MLHEIGVELGAALVAQGCPLKVFDGPESTKTTTYARERIVLEYADSDSFSAPRSQHRNPKHRMTRNVAAKITIFAQSAAAGATEWEHYRRAEHILDLVLVAMEKVIVARKSAWNVGSGKFISPEDLKASESIGGAVYELAFTVERSVFEQKWNGSVKEQVTDFAITSSDRIILANGPEDQTSETNC